MATKEDLKQLERTIGAQLGQLASQIAMLARRRNN
jgi:hypothetical protein